MNLYASQCVNTIGSYRCECLTNYRMSGDRCIPKPATLLSPLRSGKETTIELDACEASFLDHDLHFPVFLNVKWPVNITLTRVPNANYKVKLQTIIEGEFTTVLLHVTGFDDRFFNLESAWMEELAALHVEDGHRSFTTLKTRPMKRNFKIILSNRNCLKWKEAYQADHFTGFMSWMRKISAREPIVLSYQLLWLSTFLYD